VGPRAPAAAHRSPIAARPAPPSPQLAPRADRAPTTRAGLLGALKDSGIDDNASSRSFAAELLDRVPRQQAGPSKAQLQQRAALAAVKRNRGYALLDGALPAAARPFEAARAGAPAAGAAAGLRAAGGRGGTTA
jgi:hypothetical protein